MWMPQNHDEKLAELFEASHRCEEVEEKASRMHAMFWRLKGNRKSDARCRELVALHLPRGSGPVDRQGVPTFTHKDALNIKKRDIEKVNNGVKRTQKEIWQLRERRDRLGDCKRHMLTLDAIRQKAAEDAKAPAPVAKLNGFAPCKRSSEFIGDQVNIPIGVNVNSDEDFQTMAQQLGMEEVVLRELHRNFVANMDKMSMINQDAFEKTMQALQPEGTKLADRTISAWWQRLQIFKSGIEHPPKTEEAEALSVHREAYCNFKQLASWYANNTDLSRQLRQRFKEMKPT